jgi:hypothetical protein
MKAIIIKRGIVSVVAAAAFCAALSGCETTVITGGSGTPPPPGNSPNTPTVSTADLIQNKTGADNVAEVWLDNYGPGDRDGFILEHGGKVIFITDAGGVGERIKAVGSGKWSIQGSSTLIQKIDEGNCKDPAAPCIYSLSAQISSGDTEKYKSTLTLDLGDPDNNGRLVQVTLHKKTKKQVEDSFSNKKSAADRVKPVKRYVSLAE